MEAILVQPRPRRAARRICALLVWISVGCLCGASHRTANFAVEAGSPEVARQVAQRAEECRQTVAMQWLGRPLPNWSRRCPIRVKLTQGEAGGVTSFEFAPQGGVVDQVMTVEGRLDRILASAIPHEVTHTIFAAYFGGPMPRWADEGASLLSEDDRELRRHDQIVQDLFTRRGESRLLQLFQIEEYPRDLMGFYGQGYSVARFLVEMGGRPRFLLFVRDGMKQGWDQATIAHYGLPNARELDRAWRAWHTVRVRRMAGEMVVRAQSPGEPDEAPATNRSPSTSLPARQAAAQRVRR